MKHRPVFVTAGEAPSLGERERRLWLAVLASAEHDTTDPKRLDWLRSASQEPGAFLWVCEVLNLAPDPIRRAYLARPSVA